MVAHRFTGHCSGRCGTKRETVVTEPLVDTTLWIRRLDVQYRPQINIAAEQHCQEATFRLPSAVIQN